MVNRLCSSPREWKSITPSMLCIEPRSSGAKTQTNLGQSAGMAGSLASVRLLFLILRRITLTRLQNSCHSMVVQGKTSHSFGKMPDSLIAYVRICLGQQFALTEAGYVTVRLLQAYDKVDGSSHVGNEVDWFLTLTGRPFDGVKLRLHAAQ